jgi:hypothetical protein
MGQAASNASQRLFQVGLCIYVYLFSHLKHWHIDNHFFPAVFRALFVDVLILVYNFKASMKNYSMKYLQSINFSQSTFASKTEITNTVHATPYLVTSQSKSSRKETYVRIFKPAIYTTH